MREKTFLWSIFLVAIIVTIITIITFGISGVDRSSDFFYATASLLTFISIFYSLIISKTSKISEKYLQILNWYLFIAVISLFISIVMYIVREPNKISTYQIMGFWLGLYMSIALVTAWFVILKKPETKKEIVKDVKIIKTVTNRNIKDSVQKNFLALITIMIFLAVVLKTFNDKISPNSSSTIYLVTAVFIGISIINYGIFCLKFQNVNTDTTSLKVLNGILVISFIVAGIAIIGVTLTLGSPNKIIENITTSALGWSIVIVPIGIFFYITIFIEEKFQNPFK